MDFDDLLSNGLKLFQDHPDIQQRYSERFRYVMVDEYQDTNTIQAEWVDALARQHRNLMVVGDDFQSIYSWRGADFRNIMNFPKRYTDSTVLKLETNYRSTPEILAVANACIAGNPEQFQKSLKAVRESARKPRVVQLQDGDHQSVYIVEKIRHYLSMGVSASEIAVLYRSHYHAMELQIQLARLRIPYTITSGVRFFEQAHIKDACCLIRLVGNPMDELAFDCSNCSPSWVRKQFPRCGRKSGDDLIRALRGIVICCSRRCPLRQKISGNPCTTKWWCCLMRGRRFILRKSSPCLPRLYQAHAVTMFDNADRRMEDIEELIRFTTRYETVAEFLSEVALQSNLDQEPGNEAPASRNHST